MTRKANNDSSSAPFIHETAVVDPGANIGAESKIWHFCHVMSGARIGKRCTLGQNVYVGNVSIGDGVKIQNNVSVYDGVVLEDDVFVGPSAVFTNIETPRAHIERKGEFAETRVCRGGAIGANATVVCGVTLGPYSFVGAGSVVTHDVAAHSVVYGVPARHRGWACRCGEMLRAEHGTGSSESAEVTCERCGDRYSVSRRKVELIKSRG